MMTRLERYIFRNATTAFLATLFGLTGVVWITQALREVDLLTSQGQSVVVFLTITALTIPSLIMFVAPIALFAAVLYTLNRLNGDSELIVMCAAGAAPSRLLRPLLILAVLVTVLVGCMSLVVMPWTFQVLRAMLTKVRADFISRVVRPGDFTTLDKGFVFHYRERGPNGELLGIFMQDRREAGKILSYVAEAGQTTERGDDDFLVLDNGNAQRQTADTRDVAMIFFQRYAIDLAQIGPLDEVVPLRPRERSTIDIIKRDRTDPFVVRFEGRFRAELHDRFASPLYALLAVMIGFAALGEARTTRQGRGTATGLAIAAFAVLRVAGVGASTLVVRSAGAVVLDYAVPCIGIAAAVLAITGTSPLGWLPQPWRIRRRAARLS